MNSMRRSSLTMIWTLALLGILLVPSLVFSQSQIQDLISDEHLLELFENARVIMDETDRPDYSEVERLAREIIADAEKRFGQESIEYARGMDLLVHSYWRGGNPALPDAIPLAQKTLELKRGLFDDEHMEIAVTLNHLAIVNLYLGDLQSAEAAFEESLEIRTEVLGPDDIRLGPALNNLAYVYENLGKLNKASDLYKRAIHIYRDREEPKWISLAGSESNLGTLLIEMGEFEAAREHLEGAHVIFVDQLGENHYKVGTSLSNLAYLDNEIGNYDAAIDLCEIAISIHEGPDGYHPDLTASLSQLSAACFGKQDWVRAAQVNERILEIYGETLPEGHPSLAGPLLNLGWVRFMDNDPQGALEPLTQSSQIIEDVYGPDSPRTALAILNLGTIQVALGDQGAVDNYEKSLNIFTRAYGDKHPAAGVALAAFSRYMLGTGEFKRGAEMAVRAEEISRNHVRRTGQSIAEPLLLGLKNKNDGALNELLSIASISEDQSIVSTAWDQMIRSRGLIVHELISRARFHQESDDPLILERKTLFDDAATRYWNLIGRSAERELVERAQAEYEVAERELITASRVYRDLSEASGIGADQVNSAVPDQFGLVSFFKYQYFGTEAALGKESSVATYTAFVVPPSGDDPKMVSLGPASRIDDLVTRWGQACSMDSPSGSSANRSEADWEKMAGTVGDSLRGAIWDPIASDLMNAQVVLVVPDDALSFVSFAALPKKSEGYLVEDLVFHYLASEKSLIRENPRPSAGDNETVFLLGDPDFDTFQEDSLDSENKDKESTPTMLAFRAVASNCGDFDKMRFAPLPGTRREVQMLAELWEKSSGGTPPNIRLGKSAGESNFKKGAPGKTIVHVASHGLFLEDCTSEELDKSDHGGLASASGMTVTGSTNNPLTLSALVLAGANLRAEAPEGQDDGILTSQEIGVMDLRGVQWAVLSACNTAMGTIQSGESVFGLRSSFEIAGVSTLIMSLWPVGDQSASWWMANLYEARLSGKMIPTAMAVTLTSRDYLEQRRQLGMSTHPMHWGGVISSGDWR